MRSLIPIATLALAALLPATATARPLYDSVVSTPAPQFAPPGDDDGGGAAVGYVLVGLGGLALGAGGSVTLRRLV